MPSATAVEILAQRRQLILNGDIDGFADLFAPDGVIESFFAGPPGTPVRVEGREAIREYSRRVTASPLRLEDFEVAQLYHTEDPEVVVVEMRTTGTVTTTRRRFSVMSVHIVRIRGGQIVHSRDFADPRILEEAYGATTRTS